MKPISLTTLLNYIRQIEVDAVVAAGRHTTDDATMDAYRAGIREGCRSLHATLTLHGHLEVKG